MGRDHEQVLANVYRHAVVHRDGERLARGVAAEGDAAGADGVEHPDGEAGEHALPGAGEAARCHGDGRVFPEELVVAEVDPLPLRQGEVGDGADRALDLEG